MSSLTQRARLFAFDRPLSPRDPSLIETVLGVPDSLDLMAAFHRFEPYLISGPSAQGKSTLLYWLRNLVSEPEWDCFRERFIVPPREAFSSRQHLLAFLALSISSEPRSRDFAELLTKSDMLGKNQKSGRATILFLDVSQCRNPDALAWLTHGVFRLGGDDSQLAMDMRLLVVLSGAFDESMFTTGPTSIYSFQKLVLRNLTAEETTYLCHRVSERAKAFGGLRFEEDAIDELFREAGGDKCYTNLLGAWSVEAVNKPPASGPIVITRKEIAIAANWIRRGSISGDRIRRRIQILLSAKNVVSTALGELAEYGEEAWTSIHATVRQQLFETGAVGPVMITQNGTKPPGAFSLLTQMQGGEVTTRFNIRNRMIQQWIQWEFKNPRRLWLVDRQLAGDLTSREETELGTLQGYADEYVKKVAPLPWSKLKELEREARQIEENEEQDGKEDNDGAV